MNGDWNALQDYQDNTGITELAVKLFIATQTKAKLLRENVTEKEAVRQTYLSVKGSVQKMIEALGGTMPTDLPVLEIHINQIESDNY